MIAPSVNVMTILVCQCYSIASFNTSTTSTMIPIVLSRYCVCSILIESACCLLADYLVKVTFGHVLGRA